MTSDVRECLIKLAATRESSDNLTSLPPWTSSSHRVLITELRASCCFDAQEIYRQTARKHPLELSQQCVIRLSEEESYWFSKRMPWTVFYPDLTTVTTTARANESYKLRGWVVELRWNNLHYRYWISPNIVIALQTTFLRGIPPKFVKRVHCENIVSLPYLTWNWCEIKRN